MVLVCCRVVLARCWRGGGLVWVVLCSLGEVLVWSDVVRCGVVLVWCGGGRGVLCYLAGCVRGNGFTRGPPAISLPTGPRVVGLLTKRRGRQHFRTAATAEE